MVFRFKKVCIDFLSGDTMNAGTVNPNNKTLEPKARESARLLAISKQAIFIWRLWKNRKG